MVVIIILLCCMFAVGVCSAYEITHLKVKKIKLQSDKIKGKIKLVFLSDLHENSFGAQNEKLLAAIREEKPDVLLIGGDLIIGKGKRVKTSHALAFLKAVCNICPVVYTYGNHETRVKDTKEFQAYQQEVEKLPVLLLNNQETKLQIRDNTIDIYGLELTKDCYKKKKKIELQEEIWTGGKENLRILLAHTPAYFPQYSMVHPDYVFSGHNHGGIVRIPGIGGVLSTDWCIFPKYSYGLYREGSSTMILSAGAGVHTIPFRFLNPSEIMLVEIEK